MNTDFPWRKAVCLLTLTLLLLTFVAPDAEAQRARRSRSRTADAGAADDSSGDYQAQMLLRRANDLLDAGEDERGTKILEEIVKQYPQSPVRYEAYLALGRHFIDAHDQIKAIYYLNNLKQIATDHKDEEIPANLLEIYLEGMYHTGVSLFHMRQFSSAFPVLRKITDDYPNTVWANQSYYYIGMCHFAQSNWNKAIEALSVVGTFVDPESPTVQYVEAGHRFYIKIDDTDLPVLYRMGKKVLVQVSAPSGDKETVECIPLSGNDKVFVGSIPTELGPAKPGDEKLQIIGGDKITTVYLDENTREGAKDRPREATVEVVSTAAVNFTLGDYETVARAAFLGQPLFVTLHDADLDLSPNADEVQVRIVSRYREAEDEADESGRNVDIDRLFASEEERYVVRDEVLVTLRELGSAPVRTGKFAAKVELTTFSEGQPPDKSDAILSCALDDEILVTYIDELHIHGRSPREVQASARIADQISSYPQVQQMVVNDPVIAARKNIVEATAFLELARIFKSMGLTKGAGEKADEGLERVDAIISKREPIPLELKEQAFKLKWELYLAKDDLNKAIATCRVFSKAFPNSEFVDQALMGIAKIKTEEGDLREAVSIYHQVLALPNSQVKAEAQFRIAQLREADTKTRGFREAAIAEYKKCAANYPDSEFAGESLAKLIDYQIETKDYSQATDLLEQVFTDYPDAVFLDSMLLKWVMVAYRIGDFQTAYDKCSELVFQYPTSPFAEKAKDILPRIEQRINR